MLSSGEYHTEIVLLEIADIYKNLSSAAIFKSEIVFGMMLRQSRSLLFSMFQSLMFSLEAANKYSALSSKVRFVMAEESLGVIFMLVKCSRSQYFTVLSVEPLATARLAGLYSRQVTLWPGRKKLACTFPLLISHTFTDPSVPPEATHFESGESYAHVTAPVCSLKVIMF